MSISTSHTTFKLSCNIKTLKVIGLSTFVLTCSSLFVFAVVLKLSPILSPECTLENCYSSNNNQQQHFDREHTHQDTPKCTPCVFTSKTAMFGGLGTLFCAAAFCFFLYATAFTDPGYLALQHQDQAVRRDADNTSPRNDDDDQELVDVQANIALPSSTTNNNTAVRSQRNHSSTLKFQWQTASGKSRIVTWEHNSPRIEFDDDEEETTSHTTALEVRPRIKYCDTCGINRPPRASHSRKTGRCVMNFDHYCTVSHSDIGKYNILSFRFMLLSSAILVCFILALASYAYAFLITKIPVYIEQNSKMYQDAEVISLTMIIICAFAVLPLVVFCLFFLRLWFCLGGMTWRELKKRGTVFVSHDFATQFDDHCSNCIRTTHCGLGGTLGEISACSVGLCFLFGAGAEGEGPTIVPNRIWKGCCEKLRGWMPISGSSGEDDQDSDEIYDPESARSEAYVVVPRPCL